MEYVLVTVTFGFIGGLIGHLVDMYEEEKLGDEYWK